MLIRVRGWRHARLGGLIRWRNGIASGNLSPRRRQSDLLMQRRRLAPLSVSYSDEMLECASELATLKGASHVFVNLQIPILVDKRSVRQAALGRPKLPIVIERAFEQPFVNRLAHVRVHFQVPRRVEAEAKPGFSDMLEHNLALLPLARLWSIERCEPGRHGRIFQQGRDPGLYNDRRYRRLIAKRDAGARSMMIAIEGAGKWPTPGTIRASRAA
jgi:hypothetical protein